MESRLHQEAIFKHQLFHSNQSNTFSSQLFIPVHSYIHLWTQHRTVSSGSPCAHNSWLYCGHISLWHGTGHKSHMGNKKDKWATSRRSTTSFFTRNLGLIISYCLIFLILCNVTYSIQQRTKKVHQNPKFFFKTLNKKFKLIINIYLYFVHQITCLHRGSFKIG